MKILIIDFEQFMFKHLLMHKHTITAISQQNKLSRVTKLNKKKKKNLISTLPFQMHRTSILKTYLLVSNFPINKPILAFWDSDFHHLQAFCIMRGILAKQGGTGHRSKLVLWHDIYNESPEWVLSPKLYVDVPAGPWKFGFLHINFLHNYPPISIPFSKEKHPILFKLGAFYHNLLQIHPIYVIWIHLWWKPIDRCTKFRKKKKKKSIPKGRHIYVYHVNVRTPSPEWKLKIL